MNVHRNVKCVALAVPEIIAILEFWLGVVNHNLGEEEVIGVHSRYHLKKCW